MVLDRSLVAVLAIFCTALWISVLTPSFQSPDEFDHVERAYLLSKGQFFLSTPNGQASGGYVDTGLLEYMSYFKSLPHQPEVRISSEQLDSAKDVEWTGKRIYEALPGTGYYFPLIYLPQALALSLGEYLGQNLDTSYKLARLSSLGIGVLFLFSAFRILAPSAIVIGLLFLPMSLFQAASASIDFISTSVLLFIIALYISMMKDDGQLKHWKLLGLSLLIFLLAGCRLHMAPLVLLPLTLGMRFRSSYAFFLSFTLCVVIIFWYGFALTTTKDMRVDLGTPTLQIIQYYLNEPSQFFKVIWATLSNESTSLYYLHSFLGILGWLDAPFESVSYTVLFAILSLIFLLSILQGRLDDNLITFAVLLSALSGFLIIFFSLLVTWTPHPASEVLGVQGRYFFLPCLLLANLFEYKEPFDARIKRLRVIENLLLSVLVSFSVFTMTSALEARYFHNKEFISVRRTGD